MIYCKNELAASFLSIKQRPIGQAVKTPPFHGGITGSNPVGVIRETWNAKRSKFPPRFTYQNAVLILRHIFEGLIENMFAGKEL
jgi:hypothetical protein